MNIILINPLWSFQNYPPVNLAELGAYLLKNKTGNVKIVDLNYEIKNKLNNDSVIEESVKTILNKKPSVAAITCNAVQFPFVCELSKNIKSQTGIPVIIGGVMPSLNPDLILKQTKADYVIRGEGEETLTELLNAIKYKTGIENICGISYVNKSGKTAHNKDRQLLDINKLSVPAFDLIAENLKNNKNIWLTASRGCGYKCRFCSGNNIWKIQRRKNIDNIFGQIKILKNKYKVNNIIFGDDCITLNKKWFMALCKKISKLKITWGCLTRIDSLDDEIIPAMKNSGCTHVYHGIESGSKTVRKNLDKNVRYNDNNKIYEIIRKELELKLNVTCSFMTGIPFETKKDIAKTFLFAKRLQSAGAKIQLWLLTPYLGLDIVEDYKKQLVAVNRNKESLIQDVFSSSQYYLYRGFMDKYKKYNPDNYMFLPKDMAKKQFIKYFKEIYAGLGLKINNTRLTDKEMFILKQKKI